jgi:predicted transcriptional regulator
MAAKRKNKVIKHPASRRMVTLSMPEDMKKQLLAIAKKQRRSLSNLLQYMVATGLERQSAAQSEG